MPATKGQVTAAYRGNQRELLTSADLVSFRICSFYRVGTDDVGTRLDIMFRQTKLQYNVAFESFIPLPMSGDAVGTYPYLITPKGVAQVATIACERAVLIEALEDLLTELKTGAIDY